MRRKAASKRAPVAANFACNRNPRVKALIDVRHDTPKGRKESKTWTANMSSNLTQVVKYTGKCCNGCVMMTAYRVVVAHRADLVNVTLICDECGAAVTINIETVGIPEQCSCCGVRVNENALTALAALARFHRTARLAEEQAEHQEHLFRFEIRESEAILPPSH